MIKFLKRDAFNFIRWLPIYHVAELCLLCGHIDALLILGPKPGQQRVPVHTCPGKNPKHKRDCDVITPWQRFTKILFALES